MLSRENALLRPRSSTVAGEDLSGRAGTLLNSWGLSSQSPWALAWLLQASSDSARNPKKRAKKGDQDACHFRLISGSVSLPKFTQSSTRYARSKIYENSTLVYSKSLSPTIAYRNCGYTNVCGGRNCVRRDSTDKFIAREKASRGRGRVQQIQQIRQDPDQLLSSKLALPGVERDGVPRLAAEEIMQTALIRQRTSRFPRP